MHWMRLFNHHDHDSGTDSGKTTPKIKLAKCYFHSKKVLEDNKHRFSSTDHFEKFVKDCKDIGSLDTEEQFVFALQLLKQKWQSREKEAVKWFFEEWDTEKYINWFSGFTDVGIPNTNNAVKRFNNSLKKYDQETEIIAESIAHS